MKREREEIVWQTPANPPQRHDYIFNNGVRYVKPYYFEFISHAKNRWAGKTIVDLFTDEFKGRPRDYYVSAVESGRIQVEGETVPASYIVQSSQKISHFLHRHEPPVMALDVLILQKEPDVLTVYKPASVPVHPCGQYRKNTVVGILQAEHDLAPLFRIHFSFGISFIISSWLCDIISVACFMCTYVFVLLHSPFLDNLQILFYLDDAILAIHRLDRLVSGLLILARTASKADFFRQQIESGVIEKKYIAKVIGVFPEDEKIVNANVNFNAREGRSTTEVSEDCGSGITAPKGKVACTKFKRISTDGKHSIVSCQPITGRTHQIRVHLQYIGHPIANDTLYFSKSDDNVSTEGTRTNREFKRFSKSDSDLGSGDVSEKGSEKDFTIDPLCTNCPNLAPKGYDGYEEGLWLHCVQYSGPGWAYECPLPDWAILS